MQGLPTSSRKPKEPFRQQPFHVQLSAIVNNAAVELAANPTQPQFLDRISAEWPRRTMRLDAHKSTVFLPDFYPGALQTPPTDRRR